MAEIEQKRINSLTEYNGSITDVEVVLDKVGWVESLKIKLQNLAAKINHNLFANIQGGTVNEYYHLTNSQKTSLENYITELDNVKKGWNKIDLSLIDTTPSGANTIDTTSDLRSFLDLYMMLKIVQGAVTSYAIIYDISLSGITMLGESSFDVGETITELYYAKEATQLDIDLSSECFASATVSDVLSVNMGSATYRQVFGKLIAAEITCKTADTGTDSTIVAKNGANSVHSALTFNQSSGSTYASTGMTSNPTYNNLSGNFRLDTVNSGNKDTEGAVYIAYIIPNSYL